LKLAVTHRFPGRSKQKEKVEEESQQNIKKTREYRNFRKLLKQVIKAPPMPLRNKIQKTP
jgi:hypothetical protein